MIKVTIVAAGLGAASIAHAQPIAQPPQPQPVMLAPPPKPMQFGVRAGLSLASLAVDLDGVDGVVFETSRRTGLTAGLFAQFRINPNAAFEVGANYSQKGVVVKSDGGTSSIDLGYLQVPLAFVLDQSVTPGGTRVRGALGLAVNLKMNASQTVGGESMDTDDMYRDQDVALLVGVGGEVPAGTGSILLDARYEHGLHDIYNIDDNEQIDVKLKHRVITLTAGYAF